MVNNNKKKNILCSSRLSLKEIYRRKVAFRRIYQDRASLQEVEKGFIKFSTSTGRFGGYDVLGDKGIEKPYGWWETHEASCSILQQLAMRVLSWVTSS